MNQPGNPRPLPVNAMAARRPVLFLGPRDCGKSTYLGCMLLPQPDADSAEQWRVVPADDRSADYAAGLLKDIEERRPPKPTLVTEDPFWFKLQRHHKPSWRTRRPDEYDLVTVDPSGELFEGNRLMSESGRQLLELSTRASGFMLLIDPWSENTSRKYWSVIIDTVSAIAQHLSKKNPAALDRVNRILIPTAICITKMELEDDPQDAEEFLRQRIGRAYSKLKLSFPNERLRVFKCSAHGSREWSATIGGQARGFPQPWGLLEPLQWIAEENYPGRRRLFR